MLTLVVGNAEPNLEEDLCTDGLRLMPSEITEFFRLWYTSCEDQVIRVYTDTLINYIGELIENGDLLHNKVKIITPFGAHTYNDKGVIDTSWPHGIFNYSN